MTPPRERPISSILSDLFAQFVDLLRNEGRLARVEMSENLSRLGSGITLAIVGAVLLIPALVILLEAAVSAIDTTGIRHGWSALIVGIVVLVIGLAFMMFAKSRLNIGSLVPDKTIRQMQRDAGVVTEQIKEKNDYERAA